MSINTVVTQEDVDKLYWRYKMDLGNGIKTSGPVDPATKLANIKLPEDLTGWTVLDVGAWDGPHSFECERRGAARVVALDSEKWAWRNRNIPSVTQRGGKGSFQLARAALRSTVEDISMEVEDISPETVGTFDLVLFLGVLYHMRHPLLCLEKLFTVTEKLLIVGTHTNGNDIEDSAMIFYPGKFHRDPSNWWGPNKRCVMDMLKVAGFSKVDIVGENMWQRVYYHAWR